MFRRLARIVLPLSFAVSLTPFSMSWTAGTANAASSGLDSRDGAGLAFCANNGGHRLGASFDNVYACGSKRSRADGFDTDGFQCVELTVRYLYVITGVDLSWVPTGKAMVHYASTDLGIAVGRPGVGLLPAVGDIVSLWGPSPAQPAGHTAIVTSVDVDQNDGDGYIEIMEENGSRSGWNSIIVHDWHETYNSPTLYGGHYYYNHVRWLELTAATPPPAPPAPPPTQPIHIHRATFSVRGLGPNSRARAINDNGTVAGVLKRRRGTARVNQPFLLKHGVWLNPGSPSKAVEVSGINDHGAVAAWTGGSHSHLAGYALHKGRRFEWSPLPRPGHSHIIIQTSAIDPAGDVAGWETPVHSKTSTGGLVWLHVRGKYRVRRLRAARGYHDPTVSDVDHWGDAIGTVKQGRYLTYATLWFRGKSYLLPGLSWMENYSNAAAMSVEKTSTGRVVTIVGSSIDWQGIRHACQWTVTISDGYLSVNDPVDLASNKVWEPSTAIGLNSSDWVIGKFWATTHRGGTFLWRPNQAMVNLQALLPANSYWKIDSVAGINASGEIVGQGQPDQGHASGRGMLIRPQSAA